MTCSFNQVNGGIQLGGPLSAFCSFKIGETLTETGLLYSSITDQYLLNVGIKNKRLVLIFLFN